MKKIPENGGVKGNECAPDAPSAPDLHKLDDAGLIFEKQHQLTECGNCGAEFSELNIRCPTCGACLFC